MKILDFGVAKVRDPNVAEGRVTQQGVVFGTPEYMAPETARVGISDPRTDIYAVGVIFYEMLTGSIPFAGETAVDVMLKVVSEPVTPPRERAPGIEITPEAEALIMKALAKDPLKRHQSMEELRDELQQCYGSVRFRRSLEQRNAAPAAPAARRPSGPAQVVADAAGRAAGPLRRHEPGPVGGADPADQEERAAQDPADGSARQRRHPGGRRPRRPPAPPRRRRRRPARRHRPCAAVGHDEWSEPALRTPPATTAMDEWTEFDLDSPE